MQVPLFASALLLLAGSCSGLAASSLGVSGGLVIIPSLLMILPVFEVPDASIGPVAVGTSLTVSVLTGAASSYRHWRLGNLDRPFSREKAALVASCGCGAVFGAFFMSGIDAHAALWLVLLAQCYLCCAMLRPRARPQHRAPARVFSGCAMATRTYFALVGLLASIGAGGTLIAPYLSAKGVSQRETAALASWLSIPIGACAALTYATRVHAASDGCIGGVCLPAALLLGTASICTVHYGALLATRVNPAVLRIFLALVVVSSCVQLALRLAA